MKRRALSLLLVTACTTTWRSASVHDLGEHPHAFVVTDDHAYELTVDNTRPQIAGAVQTAWTFDRAHAGPLYKDEDPLPIARRLHWTHTPSPGRVQLDESSVRHVRVEVLEGPSAGEIAGVTLVLVLAGALGFLGWTLSQGCSCD